MDVGGGTGFCTQGIVQSVRPENVTLLDQSDHQMAKAKKKADLQGVTIMQGDAEDLPFENDTFDRYVSAGSIEYWPEPQRGIRVRCTRHFDFKAADASFSYAAAACEWYMETASGDCMTPFRWVGLVRRNRCVWRYTGAARVAIWEGVS